MSTERIPLDLPAVAKLADLADYVTPLALRAVAELGVADLLADGPLPVDTLADRLGVHAPTLLRTLRALAARGVFTEVEPGTFGLTPLARPLRAAHPLSLRDAYPLLPADLQAWAYFAETLRTGEPGFPLAHGVDYWTYLAAEPEQSARTDRWMQSVNRLHLRTVLPAYAFARFGTVVDVGGGTGAFLAGLLARNPRMRGVLVDLPHVVDAAPDVLAAAGVADRCQVVPGSFFEALPGGADGYLLKTVLPGFDDDAAGSILSRVREAMRDDSLLVLIEAVLPPGDAFDVAKLFDVHTLVLTGGCHRTSEHMERLLTDAGLRLVRVIPTATVSVLEVSPAGPAVRRS
ncbi:methyltransferase [Micromonospora andamanensis]|uniref:Hydroxyneurosporene-O-methyltransferase n=1 Tax=Micromonospora andamanensis TaxID=1287068 RepID=A0ABQ4HTS3_9ACTN|nr:methyltransferase [Micromonospora andamanensis]GIJ08916.1 hydroxyneurosporene-O-methyltransferase [Micromonospora andamanensis]